MYFNNLDYSQLIYITLFKCTKFIHVMVKSISDKLSINILCNEVIYSEQNTMPQVRILIFGLMKKKQKNPHNPRSPPEEMSEIPHGDTNSGRTGSGVEVNAILFYNCVLFIELFTNRQVSAIKKNNYSIFIPIVASVFEVCSILISYKESR